MASSQFTKSCQVGDPFTVFNLLVELIKSFTLLFGNPLPVLHILVGDKHKKNFLILNWVLNYVRRDVHFAQITTLLH